jgi:hypothetical protein
VGGYPRTITPAPNDGTIENKGTSNKRNTTDHQCPTMNTIYIQVIEGIRVNQKVERQQPLWYITFLCKIFPLATRYMQEQPRHQKQDEQYNAQYGELS